VIWLLDTNMLVYARNGVAPVVARLDDVWEQGEVVTSLLVVGELIYGVEKSIAEKGTSPRWNSSSPCSMASCR
jgi:predicted nucleic acid-binding protein